MVFALQLKSSISLNFLKCLIKVACHPICSENVDFEAVLEFIRTKGTGFTDDGMEVTAISYIGILNC